MLYRYMKQMYALTNQIAKGKKVIITETGWPGKGENVSKKHILLKKMQ